MLDKFFREMRQVLENFQVRYHNKNPSFLPIQKCVFGKVILVRLSENMIESLSLAALLKEIVFNNFNDSRCISWPRSGHFNSLLFVFNGPQRPSLRKSLVFAKICWHGLEGLTSDMVCSCRFSSKLGSSSALEKFILPWFTQRWFKLIVVHIFFGTTIFILDDMISVWSSLRSDVDSRGLPDLNHSSKYLKGTNCNNSIGNANNSMDDRSKAVIILEVSHTTEISLKVIRDASEE